MQKIRGVQKSVKKKWVEKLVVHETMSMIMDDALIPVTLKMPPWAVTFVRIPLSIPHY